MASVGEFVRFSEKDKLKLVRAAEGVANRIRALRRESRGSSVYVPDVTVRTAHGPAKVNAEHTDYGWRAVVHINGDRYSYSIDPDMAVENPSPRTPRRLSKAAGARLCACNGGRVANPDVLRIPPMPSSLPNYNTLSGTANMRAWDKWTADVQAIPARFDGQPAYVKEMWALLEDGFGRVSKGGEVVTFDPKYDDHLWRKYPALKGKKTASIRLLENGEVVAMRGPTPAKRAPKTVGRKAKAGKKTSVRRRVSSTKRVANPRSKRAKARRKTTR